MGWGVHLHLHLAWFLSAEHAIHICARVSGGFIHCALLIRQFGSLVQKSQQGWSPRAALQGTKWMGHGARWWLTSAIQVSCASEISPREAVTSASAFVIRFAPPLSAPPPSAPFRRPRRSRRRAVTLARGTVGSGSAGRLGIDGRASEVLKLITSSVASRLPAGLLDEQEPRESRVISSMLLSSQWQKGEI